jgi:hypothetical protein
MRRSPAVASGSAGGAGPLTGFAPVSSGGTLGDHGRSDPPTATGNQRYLS